MLNDTDVSRFQHVRFYRQSESLCKGITVFSTLVLGPALNFQITGAAEKKRVKMKSFFEEIDQDF